MAMLPKYYPGLPEDPYMEYLQKLGQFQQSSSDLPYTSLTNLRIENQYPGVRQIPALADDPVEVMNRNRPFPQFNRLGPQFPAAYSESPVPGTAEMMRAADRRADAIIAEAQQRGSRPRPVQPIAPPSMGPPPSTGNVPMPVQPQTSAPAQAQSAPAQGGGLLDVDMNFYDDPTRMGLLQAGLGLLSAPRYSTNPNDVTLSSALARGLGGFIQGYGTTKKRLTEAERQKLEDEYKRSQMEFDKLHKTALTNEAIGRTEQMKVLLAQPAKDQKEWEEKVRKIYPNPDNKTGQALIAAGPVEGAKKLAKLAGGMTETERTGLFNKIKNDSVLPEDDKAMLLEMVNERDFEGKLSNSSVAINNAINQLKDDLKQKTKPRGSQAERDEDILINATAEQANDPKVQMAFQRLFLEPSDETTQWNPQKQQTERFKTYPTIPSFYVEKFPALAQQQEQLKNQSSVVPAKPNLTEKKAKARGDVLAAFEQEILNNDYDEPLGMFNVEGMLPRRFQSDEFQMQKDSQDRWIENVLRAASGAEIKPEEYESYRNIYFTTPGEGPEAKERKRQMRALKVQEAQLKIAEQARIQGALPQVSEDPDDILLQ